MRELRNRVATLVARVRAGEGAEVLAELGETMERWLERTSLPIPSRLRIPLEQLGEVLGDFARAHRPGPAEAPPPPEPIAEPSRSPLDHAAAAPAPQPRAPAVSAVETAPTPRREPRERAGKPAANGGAVAKPNGSAAKKPRGEDGQRPKRSKPKPASASAKKGEAKPRVSARRSTTAKKVRAESSAPKPSEPPTRKKSNGKGRTRRPAARRSRDDKTDKPT